MFAILLLLFILNSSSSAPVVTSTAPNDTQPMLFGRQLPDCLNAARHRTTQDIIWSCLATVFACTWVAIHPNLPGPGDSGWMRFKRRIVTMIYALIAPEFTVLWALRQWIAAKRIVREYNSTTEAEVLWYLCIPQMFKASWVATQCAVKDWFQDPRKKSKKWTLTHGFFIQMGGFILYEGETPKRVLTFEDLKELIAKKSVDAPTISEHEINDRNKGDFLTKLVVVLQTSWFIFQCLARWASHLPVTELEVVTLAFAALNIITYALWWQKPQGILVAVPVQLKPDSDIKSINEGLRLLGNGDDKKSWLPRKLKKDMDTEWFWQFCIHVPYRLVNAVIRPISKVGQRDLERNSLRVPMFYSEARKAKEATLYPIMIIGILFGGLHLIPWSSSFPTYTESRLWRSSAILITVFPVLPVFGDFSASLDDYYGNYFSKFMMLAIAIPYSIGVILYPLARLILLALAFTTLRTLPPDAALNIEWTTFIPHI